jgi:hypothetical protein
VTIFSWIPKVYFYFLWITGFSDTDGLIQTPDDREKITFMLRRMKERLGIIWWCLSLGTLLGVWALCLLVSWWYILLEAFLLWLFVHVLEGYLPNNNIWGGRK